MSEYRRTRPRDGHERAFRLLLALFPPSFRAEFGDAMLEFFRDRLAGARAAHGAKGVADSWLAATQDVARQAPLAWIDAARSTLRSTLRVARARLVRRPPDDPLHISRQRDWMLSTILQDLRYGMRGIARSPGFSLVVVLTLALGLGANAAIYSVVRGVILKPLPYARPHELVRVEHREPYYNVSEPEFADYRREARALAGLGAARISTASITGSEGEAEGVEVAAVSDGFFGVMRLPALLGRTFTPEEEKPGGPEVAVVSHALWQRRFGGDSGIVGRAIRLDGTSRTVVGVMPPRFDAPLERVTVWTPLRLRYDSLWERNNHYLMMIGRLAPGATITRAQGELDALAKRFASDFPQYYAADNPLRVKVAALGDSVVGGVRPYLFALFGAVAFVLVIACVNVAGLLLARGESRRKELAIRAAMGASRVRLVRQVLSESALHALAGGTLGMAIAWWSVRLLHAVAPADLPRVNDVRIDGGVLLFTTLVSLATGLAFGAWPAVRGSRDDAVESLKEGGKGSSGGGSRGAGRARQRLVVAEMAIAVVTLTGAGVMLRSLWAMQAIDLGFRAEGALTMQVGLPPATYRGERTVAFYRGLTERVRAMPGVEQVGAVQDLPVADGYSSLSILVDGMPPVSTAQAPVATPMIVTPGYFAAMAIPLVRGRLLTDADAEGAPLVVVASEAMVRKHWPGRDPVGATVRMLGLDGQWATVVGVVRDVRVGGFAGEMLPTLYFPHAQAGKSAYYTPARMSLVVRASGDPSVLAGPVRALVRALEPNAPVSRVQPMTQVVAESVETRRFVTRLLAGFALLALALAALGLYGVIAYSVTQRQQELGVRLALGAHRAQVLALVLGEGMRTALAGAAIGIAGSLVLARLLRAAFADVAPWDPVTLIVVVALLMAVALVASYLPARRASRIDPMPALRAQ